MDGVKPQLMSQLYAGLFFFLQVPYEYCISKGLRIGKSRHSSMLLLATEDHCTIFCQVLSVDKDSGLSAKSAKMGTPPPE